MWHLKYSQCQEILGKCLKPLENKEIVICQVPGQIGIPGNVNMNMLVKTSLASELILRFFFLFREGEKMH